MPVLLATYGRELVTEDRVRFGLAPDAAPKLVLMGLLLALLVLWLWGFFASAGPER